MEEINSNPESSQIINQVCRQKDLGSNARFPVPFVKKVLEEVPRENAEGKTEDVGNTKSILGVQRITRTIVKGLRKMKTTGSKSRVWVKSFTRIKLKECLVCAKALGEDLDHGAVWLLPVF